jgi:alanine dehydrogenase
MNYSDDLLKMLSNQALQPQDSMLEVANKGQKLYIGIPKESVFQENRVALVPNAVKVLVSVGHEVVVETGAGKRSNFVDKDYSEAGAKIAYDAKEVYQSDLVLKVAPPSLEEIELMKNGQTLISSLQMSTQSDQYLKCLVKKKVTAIAYDYIKDSEGIFPVVRALSEIAGRTSVLIASELLNNATGGRGTLFGGVAGVPPIKVMILGAGTVGEYATRSAIGLGAAVRVFDDSIHRLRRLQNDIGREVFTSIMQPDILANSMKDVDVIIGAIRSKDGRTPCVITSEMVSKMKFGSVIVDVSIDRGGCFETSRLTNHKDPVYSNYGVIHYCVPNIGARVSRTASYALSNVFAPLLKDAGEYAGINHLLKNDSGVRNGVYIYKGCVTNKSLADIYKLPFKDLDLLMSAF